MKVYVKSRWQHHPKGLGYFWQPTDKHPEVISKIESYNELISDHFCIMALWGEYRSRSYYLYITGINSGYKDIYNRPIKHTVLWEGEEEYEQQFRNIMIDSVSGKLENLLQQMIHSDVHKGFKYEEEKLRAIGIPDNDTCKDNKNDDFAKRSEITEHLKKYRLPSFSGIYFSAPEGLLVAVGKGLSLQRLKKDHKYIKWVFDPTLNQEGQNEI